MYKTTFTTLIWTLTMQSIASEDICAVVSNSTDLEFVDKYPHQPMWEVASQYFYLSCCTGRHMGVTSQWFKWIPATESWCLQDKGNPGCFDTRLHFTSELGQVLNFENACDVCDTGKYLCSATDGLTAINRTFHVRIFACTENPSRVVVTRPGAVQQTSVGRKFTANCAGDFGCYGALSPDNRIWWSVQDESGQVKVLTPGVTGHYTVNNSISDDQTTKAATLTIDSVEQTDFHATFICSLKMKTQPVTRVKFVLEEEAVDEVVEAYVVAVGVLSAVLVGIGVALLSAYCLCGPYLVYRGRCATNRLPARSVEHRYDVMLVAVEEEEEEDRVLYHWLKGELQQKGYTIYSLHPGQQEASQMDDIEKCVSVVFVMSSLATLGDERMSSFSSFFNICTDCNTSIIFVHGGSRGKGSGDGKEYGRVFSLIPKLCPVIHWPGEHAGWRRAKVFWGSLQSALPKPHGVKVNKGEGHALLA